MLGKQVGEAGNTVAFQFGDIIQVAAVVIPRRPKEPCIEAMGCPRCPRVGIFIDNCLGTKWCQGVLIPVIRSFKYFIRQFGWVDSGAPEEVDGVLHLGGKLVPKLDGKVHTGGAKGTNESILESLDGLFGSVDAVIAWFD
jgi:hypothetical protein